MTTLAPGQGAQGRPEGLQGAVQPHDERHETEGMQDGLPEALRQPAPEEGADDRSGEHVATLMSVPVR
jgi:hypothetical protein